MSQLANQINAQESASILFLSPFLLFLVSFWNGEENESGLLLRCVEKNLQH